MLNYLSNTSQRSDTVSMAREEEPEVIELEVSFVP